MALNASNECPPGKRPWRRSEASDDWKRHAGERDFGLSYANRRRYINVAVGVFGADDSVDDSVLPSDQGQEATVKKNPQQPARQMRMSGEETKRERKKTLMAALDAALEEGMASGCVERFPG